MNFFVGVFLALVAIGVFVLVVNLTGGSCG